VQRRLEARLAVFAMVEIFVATRRVAAEIFLVIPMPGMHHSQEIAGKNMPGTAALARDR
jgi:hypothetical protein